MTTSALPHGNDRYVVTGGKLYITGAEMADILLTVAKTSTSNAKAYGIVMVPGVDDGLSVEALIKLAGNAMPSCWVMFDEVVVPTANILGGAGAAETAWPFLRQTGALERLIVAAMACGIARAATARATEFTRDRRQFGKALKDFQSIQYLVVEMSTLTRGMELFVESAVRAHSEMEDPTQAISMAKYFCSEQLQRVVEIAVRVMGGRAFFDFEPVSSLYRYAPFCLFAGGTVEIQKMLIARTLKI